MLSLVRPAVVTLALMSVLTGGVYPLAVTAIAQLLPGQANGSQVRDASGVRGSTLIGQAFARPEYLHGRPSAAGNGYDPTQSGGTNYGPLEPKLAARVAGDAALLAKPSPGAAIPADAVTTSASGVDPDISPAYAALQVPRIAAARHAPASAVEQAVAANTRGRTLGVLGEPRVNVLEVNLALDAALPKAR